MIVVHRPPDDRCLAFGYLYWQPHTPLLEANLNCVMSSLIEQPEKVVIDPVDLVPHVLNVGASDGHLSRIADGGETDYAV